MKMLGVPLVLENGEIELAKALGIRDQVDLDDLPSGDREPEDDPRPSTLGPHDGLAEGGKIKMPPAAQTWGGVIWSVRTCRRRDRADKPDS